MALTRTPRSSWIDQGLRALAAAGPDAVRIEPLARALGYPKKKIGYADILKLATAPNGWASVGHPEFGRFKYVHTNPDSSTSGAEAVAGSYYAFAGKKEGLTQDDVKGSASQVKRGTAEDRPRDPRLGPARSDGREAPPTRRQPANGLHALAVR